MMVRLSLKPYILLGALLMLWSALPDCLQAGAIRFEHLFSIYADSLGARLKYPQGVACGSDNRIIVADTGNGRLVRYTFTEDATKPQSEVFKLAQLPYPQKIRIHPKGDIYVLDGKLRQIARLGAQGKFISYVEPAQSLQASSPLVRSFDIDVNGNLYLLDLSSKSVIVTDALGQYIRSIRFPKEYGFFSDVAVDQSGNVLLVDSINAMLYSAGGGSAEFAPMSARLKEYMRFPTGLVVEPKGRIFVVDRNGSKIIILASNGVYVDRLSAMGWKEGLLNYPFQMCLNGQNQVIVADTNNHRIQFFEELK